MLEMMHETDVFIGVLLSDPPFIQKSRIQGLKNLNWRKWLRPRPPLVNLVVLLESSPTGSAVRGSFSFLEPPKASIFARSCLERLLAR